MEAPAVDRRDQLLNQDLFRSNAISIIDKMLELSEDRPDTFVYVDEILHSIFFLGNIHIPPCSPEYIVNDPEIFEALTLTYPQPFELYSSQLPRRSPFSCVLDMVVQVTGEREERNIIRQLQDIIRKVDPSGSRKLVSSTICVSQKCPDSTRHYGVSMSTERGTKIMIGASCLSNWHPIVANAVMTYYPHKTMKQYFNGTFTLESEVRCKTFDLMKRREFVKRPCMSCHNLYGLTPNDIKEFKYGNCAEAESLSNLLKNTNGVDIIRPNTENSEKNRQRARCQVENDLRSFLKLPRDFPLVFYTPRTE